MKGYFLSNINNHIVNKQRVFSPHCQLEKALTMIRSLVNQANLEQFEVPKEILYQEETFFKQGQARFFIERSFQNLKDFGASVKKCFDKYPESKIALAGKQQYTPAVDQAQLFESLMVPGSSKTRFFSSRIKNDPIIDLFVEAIRSKRLDKEAKECHKQCCQQPQRFYSTNNPSSYHCEDPKLITQIISQKEIQSSSFVYLDFFRLLLGEGYLNKDLRINREKIDELIRKKYHIQEEKKEFAQEKPQICEVANNGQNPVQIPINEGLQSSQVQESTEDKEKGQNLIQNDIKASDDLQDKDNQQNPDQSPQIVSNKLFEQNQASDEENIKYQILEKLASAPLEIGKETSQNSKIIIPIFKQQLSYQKKSLSPKDSKELELLDQVILEGRKNNFKQTPDPQSQDENIIVKYAQINGIEDYSTSKNKIQHFIKDVYSEVLNAVVLPQNCESIKWKDANTLDELLAKQTEKETEHIKKLKDKMSSFLKLHMNESDEQSLVSLISQKNSDQIQVPFKDSQPGNPEVYQNEKSKWALMYFVLCLLEETPSGCYYEMIEEMERLSFVGTSAITLCTVLYLTITDKFKTNEKIMDLKKNMIIEKTNISRKGKDMGFHRQKYAITHDPNNRQNADASKIVQRLAGFFSLYLGIDACLQFLIKIKVIPIPQDEDESKVFINLQKSLNQFKADQELIQSPQRVLTDEVLNNRLVFNDLKKFGQRFSNLKNLVIKQSQSVEENDIDAQFDQSKHLFLQCVTHSSFCDVIGYKQNNNELPKMFSTDLLSSFNYQRLEYLGDSILNFSIVKRLYFDTALQNQKWQRNYYTSRKLDDIKKFITSNNFLGILLYHQFKQVKTNEKDEIPLLYDQTSQVFSDEISKYNKCLRQWFKTKIYVEQQQTLSFSLGNYFYNKEISEGNSSILQKQKQHNYYQVIDLKLKTFADIFEALIGAVFVSSGTLGSAINFSLNMLSSQIFQDIEDLDLYLESEKSTVCSIYGSKPYTYSYNLTHQEKSQSSDHVMMNVFVSTMQVKAIKQDPSIYDKIGCLYKDIGKFMRDAYYKFETKQLSWNEQSMLNAYSYDLGATWFQFLDNFRKGHKLSDSNLTPQPKIFSTIAQGVVDLNGRDNKLSIEYGEANVDLKLNEMKERIIFAYQRKFGEYQDGLVNLELERVQNKEVREAYFRCDIKNVNPMRCNIKTFKDLLNYFSQNGDLKWRILKLYDQLWAYDELHRPWMHIEGIHLKDSRSSSSDSLECSEKLTDNIALQSQKRNTLKDASMRTTQSQDSEEESMMSVSIETKKPRELESYPQLQKIGVSNVAQKQVFIPFA